MFKDGHDSRSAKGMTGYAYDLAERKKWQSLYILSISHGLPFFEWSWSFLALADFPLLFQDRFLDCSWAPFFSKGFIPSFCNQLLLISYAKTINHLKIYYVYIAHLFSGTIFPYPADASLLLPSLPFLAHLVAPGLVDLCSPCSHHVLLPAPVDTLHLLVHFAGLLAMTLMISVLASTFPSTLPVPFCAYPQGNHMIL